MTHAPTADRSRRSRLVVATTLAIAGLATAGPAAASSGGTGLSSGGTGGDPAPAPVPGAKAKLVNGLAVPPKELCPECGARRWEPVPLSGEGTIASFTVIRVAPRGHADEAPYAIAAVRLREGVSLLGRVVDVPLDSLAIGMPVRFRPIVVKDRPAIGFGPRQP